MQKEISKMTNAAKTLKTKIPPQLLNLGITIPTPEEARQLDERGYVILPDILKKEQCLQLGSFLDELEGQVAVEAELKSFQVEEGATRFANLIDQGPVMDIIWSHPRVLGCVWHVINREFKISSLNAREPKKGQGHQGLHADWGPRIITEPKNHVVNCLWILDGMTKENGATRFIPGSHKIAGRPSDYMKDTKDPHPDQISVVAPQGAVVIYNAHSWHSGSTNFNGARRRVLHAFYTARENPQQQIQQKWLSEKTKTRLDPDRRWLLEV